MCPELRRALSHPTWLEREVARLAPTSRGVDAGALSPTAVASLAIQRLAGRSQACVSLGMRKRVHARSVRMALCGDRGAGGASARSQRAPARSRARERCRFKRGCRAERLVVLRLTCARQHDGQVRGVKVSGTGARAGADGVVLRARRGVGGDVPGPWQGRRQARIAQRLHVGELEPEPCFLGVGGQFRDLVRTT